MSTQVNAGTVGPDGVVVITEMVTDRTAVQAARRARIQRGARLLAIGVLTVDAVALTAAGAFHRSDDPVPVHRTVVESRCIDGHVDQSIDDGDPAGLLAYDTGVSC